MYGIKKGSINLSLPAPTDLSRATNNTQMDLRNICGLLALIKKNAEKL